MRRRPHRGRWSAIGAVSVLLAAFSLAVPALGQDGQAAVEGVVAREGGGPLVDASIELWDASGVTGSATTDADGRFHVDAPSAGAYWLHVSHACCTRQIHNVTIGAGGTTAHDVVLWPQTTKPAGDGVLLWGHMADPRTTEPTPWVQISASLTDGSFSTQTASRGDGSYFLEVPAGSLQATARRTAAASTYFELDLAQDTYLGIPVYLDSARVDLKLVVDSESADASGELVEECADTACAPVPAQSGDGTFTFDAFGGSAHASVPSGFTMTRTRAAAGLWTFSASAPGYAPAYAQIEIRPGDVWTLEARLVEGEVERHAVGGRVVDADGSPLEGIRIDARNEPAGDFPSVPATDEAGGYAFAIRPGLVRIEAVAHPNVTQPAYGKSFYPESRMLMVDADRRDVDFTLLEKRSWPAREIEVLGWVVDGDSGRGVPDTRVVVRNEDSTAWGETVTGQDGSYRFAVPAGYYTVAAYVADAAWVLGSASAESGRAWANLTYRAPPAPTGDGWYGTLVEDFYVPGAQPTSSPTPSPPSSSPEPEPERRPLSSGPSGPGAVEPLAVEGSASYAGQAGGLGPYTASVPPEEGQDDDVSRSPRPATDVPFPTTVAVIASAAFAAAWACRRPPRR